MELIGHLHAIEQTEDPEVFVITIAYGVFYLRRQQFYADRRFVGEIRQADYESQDPQYAFRHDLWFEVDGTEIINVGVIY